MFLTNLKKHTIGAALALVVLLGHTTSVWAQAEIENSPSVLQGHDLPPSAEHLPDLPSSNQWVLSRANDSDEVRIESLLKNGQPVEILHLPGQETLELVTPLDSAELAELQLSPEQIELAREDARQVLELTLRGALAKEFTGDISTSLNGPALGLQPNDPETARTVSAFFKRIFYSQDSNSVSVGRKVSEKFKQSIRGIWKFVFVETLKAGVDYYRLFKNNRSRFTEFGLVLDIKLEPQIFISKFNPTQRIKLFSRSYALFLEISYSRTEKRVMIRTRYRREKGTGGLGLPAMKAEFKFFESDGRRGAYRGQSWYPVSPPLVSFVLDSSSHYFAQGITIGINSGDLVPGSTLTNTFTQFVQTDNTLLSTDRLPISRGGAGPRSERDLQAPLTIRTCRQLLTL